MKRKKIKEPIIEEIIEFSGVVYSSKYVNYREDGSIISISSEIESENYLTIELDLIPNFVSGSKDIHNYNIEYFKKIKLGLIKDSDELDSLVRSDYIHYTIPYDQEDSEVKIFHDLKNKKWIVEFCNYINLEMFSSFTFFVVLKNNKNFILSSYYVKIENNNPIEFSFLTDEEENFNSIFLLTCKKFKSYSVKEAYVK